jgi:hypothetical protein
MNHIDEIDNLTRLTRKREFDDGFVDLIYAGVFLVIGLANWFIFSTVGLNWFINALVRQREITIIGLLTLVPLLVLAIFGLRRLVERIRQATIWKDSGTVKPLRWQVRRSISAASVLIPIGLIIAGTWLMARGVLSEEEALRVLAASVGSGIGIVYLGMGIDLRLSRYIAAGIAGLILSAVVVVQPVAFSMSWLMIGLGWMTILGASGLWALRQSLSKATESSGG